MSNESIKRRAEDLRTRLMAQGIISVCVQYDGYADEGFLDMIEGLDADERGVELDRADRDKLHDVFYDLLEQRFAGWENDSGACGTFTWHLPSNALTHVHDARYETYDRTEVVGWDEMAEAEERRAVAEETEGV